MSSFSHAQPPVELDVPDPAPDAPADPVGPDVPAPNDPADPPPDGPGPATEPYEPPTPIDPTPPGPEIGPPLDSWTRLDRIMPTTYPAAARRKSGGGLRSRLAGMYSA